MRRDPLKSREEPLKFTENRSSLAGACTYPLIYTVNPLNTAGYPLVTTAYPLITASYPLVSTAYPLITASYPLITASYPLIYMTYPLYYFGGPQLLSPNSTTSAFTSSSSVSTMNE